VVALLKSEAHERRCSISWLYSFTSRTLSGVESKYRRVGYYAVFFDNDDYKGSSMSVMIDNCEKPDYRPFP
jgi:hypothetical protein